MAREFVRALVLGVLGWALSLAPACGQTPSEGSGTLALATQSLQRDPGDMITAALAADDRLVYVGVQQIEEHGKEQGSRSRREVHRDGPRGRTRYQYLSPGLLAGAVVLQRGGDRWQYRPDQGRWLHEKTLPEMLISFTDTVDLLFRNYEIEAAGESSVAGRRCLVYEILPRNSGNPSRRLHVDAEMRLPLRTENVNGLGELVSVATFESIEFVDQIEASVFAPPEGPIEDDPVRREGPIDLWAAEGEAGFPVREPRYIPEGYRFAGAFIIRTDKSLVVHLQWFDGLSLISLFKQRAGTILPDSAWERYHANTVTWTSGGYLYTLMGDLVPPELARIRDSVR